MAEVILSERTLAWFATDLQDANERIIKLEEENRKLKERVNQLEERLDNKEKVNKQLREELKELNKMMLFETELEK